MLDQIEHTHTLFLIIFSSRIRPVRNHKVPFHGETEMKFQKKNNNKQIKNDEISYKGRLRTSKLEVSYI